jgi:hypothetical protein
VIAWLRGWAATLRIMIFQRGLYIQLLDSKDAPLSDYVDAPPPESYR